MARCRKRPDESAGLEKLPETLIAFAGFVPEALDGGTGPGAEPTATAALRPGIIVFEHRLDELTAWHAAELRVGLNTVPEWWTRVLAHEHTPRLSPRTGRPHHPRPGRARPGRRRAHRPVAGVARRPHLRPGEPGVEGVGPELAGLSQRVSGLRGELAALDARGQRIAAELAAQRHRETAIRAQLREHLTTSGTPRSAPNSPAPRTPPPSRSG